MSKIYQIYGQDAREMNLRLLETSESCKLVPAEGSVALKPNPVIAGTPESGATTHSGVLSGCIEYFPENGVMDISVIEGSWIGDETMRAMRRAGYDKVCNHYGVPFYDLKKDKTRTVKTAAGPIDICCRALDAGLLVDLPVLKGHGQTIMTCALKNLKGCLPDREKRHFHAMGLQKPIAALGAALKPGLIVVDSICGDLDFEEGGNPIQTNRMYLGTDAVQLDAYGLSLMGLNQEDVPYVGMCEAYGGGRADPQCTRKSGLLRLLRGAGAGAVLQPLRTAGDDLYRSGLAGKTAGWPGHRKMLRRGGRMRHGMPANGGKDREKTGRNTVGLLKDG